MNWYLAKLVFRIICGDGDHTPQFDEQLRLIYAADEDEALYKAIQLGTDEQDCFANNKQQMVHWMNWLHDELRLLAQRRSPGGVSSIFCLRR